MRGLPSFGRRRRPQPELQRSDPPAPSPSPPQQSSVPSPLSFSNNSMSTGASTSSKADAAIASTADDAILSKLNSSLAGYYDDPFLSHFAGGASGLTSLGGSSSASAPPSLLLLQGLQAGPIAGMQQQMQAGVAPPPLGVQRQRHIQQQQHHHRAAAYGRAHSSPPESASDSSSVSSSFYDDEIDGDRHDQRRRQHHTLQQQQQQQQHLQHHHARLGLQGTMSLHSGIAGGGPGRAPNFMHHSHHPNPLSNCSPSEIHPALRHRLGAASGHGVHPGIHPGLRGSCGGGGGSYGCGGVGGQQRLPQGQPIIRRGTHARVCVIDRAITAFLGMELNDVDADAMEVDDGPDQQRQANGGKEVRQVVILGAGRDTSYLRHLAGLLGGEGVETKKKGASAVEEASAVRWYEVDHPGVIRTKMDLLRTCPLIDIVETGIDNNASNDATTAVEAKTSFALDVRMKGSDQPDATRVASESASTTGPATAAAASATSPSYHLIGHDLRSPPSTLFATLQSSPHNFDPTLPTLFVMECVQMYLPDSCSRSLLRGIASTMTSFGNNDCVVALYDPILGDDGFGRVMEQHLTRAGVVAPPPPAPAMPPPARQQQQLCLTACRTLDSNLLKLIECGWDRAVGCDMLAAYETVVSSEQRARAAAVEILDEVEEWVLIMRHYCFVVGGVLGRSGGVGDGGGGLAARFCAVRGADERRLPSSLSSPLGFVEGRCSMRCRADADAG